MALGKYSRVDGRKSSSNYCSTVTIVVFVALCLVGVWMMTSSSVVPVQNPDQESKNDVNENTRVSDSKGSGNIFDNGNNENKSDNSESSSNDNEGKAKQFEDNPGDLPEDATKEDNSVNSNQEEKKSDVKTTTEDEIVEGKDKSEDSKSEMENGDDNKGSGETTADDKDSEASETNDSSSGGGESGNDNDKKADDNSEDTKNVDNVDGETGTDKKDALTDQNSGGGEETSQSNDLLPSGAQSELLNETTTQNGAFSTQAAESKKENEGQISTESEKSRWKLCNVTAGSDYIPCLDNIKAIRKLHSTKHYEHRERHCPNNAPTCLVTLPEGYQRSIEWPTSREKIWYHNVPHTKLAEVKGHQNWVKVSGEYLTFPGGGTQFKHGALHYIDFIQQSVPDVAWGKRTRVVLDVGCGVASFGGFLFDRDVLTMSLAPKDEHEAQVQFALERGIPGISAVMGTKRLPFPGRVFDIVHCARCRVPWHIEGGKLLLELNRLLRPGGFFVWSATPIYQKNVAEDVEIWEAMKKLTKSMCWENISITKDRVNGVGIAIYRKPTNNECYEQRSQNEPALCQESDDPNAAWNVPLQTCMHKIPVGESERGSQWPELWPARVGKAPYWLLSSQVGVYGKPAPQDFAADSEHWNTVVTKSYVTGLGINWSTVRNVMDMRSVYGGFAAALKDMKVWVLNIVSIDAPDTLPIIYERGLFGMYHDWCESFSTYPRTYDLLHADHLFSRIKMKCDLDAFVAELDRILRPEGKIIVRDAADVIKEIEGIFKSLHWEIRMVYSKDREGLLCAQKTMWRPKQWETLSYAIE